MLEKQYYNEIKNKLVNNEIYGEIKDYSKEKHRVLTYYEVGKLLNDAGKHYGDDVIGKFSEMLSLEIGTKYNKRLLFRMKQFYLFLNKQKVSPLGTQLTWSHYRALLSLDNQEEINYYIQQVVFRNLSKRKLEEIIKNKEYERLPKNTKNHLTNKEKVDLCSLIKNPIIIRNNTDQVEFNEKILHRLILEDMTHFLIELGDGFCYIDNEYPCKLGDRYNYIDFLLYNIIFRCYVVVEIKVRELKAEYIGQIQKYMNYIDKNKKGVYETKTIGIIICKKDNRYIIEYSSDERVISREYLLK